MWKSAAPQAHPSVSQDESERDTKRDTARAMERIGARVNDPDMREKMAKNGAARVVHTEPARAVVFVCCDPQS